MSFKRFDQEDLVISAESITSPAWSSNQITLQSFFTSSGQIGGASGEYYYNIYNLTASDAATEIQFSLAYGNKAGLGSTAINSNVPSNTPSSIVYKQYRNLVNGSEDIELSFGGTDITHIYALPIERARFKEKLLPGSLSLKLFHGTGAADYIILTDDSKQVTTQTFTDAGRVFNIISGSAGDKTETSKDTANKGYSLDHGSYGLFLPDIGLILLNGKALDAPVANGGIALTSDTGSSFGGTENMQLLFNSLIRDGNQGTGQFTVRSEETVSSNFVFVRARNSEFNYSTNPSNITGSGELRHSVMIDTPQSFITTVGLYNDNNDLLAVAKLSRPLLKDFTKEALVRIKLDY